MSILIRIVSKMLLSEFNLAIVFKFPPLGSFYPFSILAKNQTLSKFEANFLKQAGKKDKYRDK